MFEQSTKTEKQIIGQKGEDLACKYLKQNGFKIIERNYWKPWGEIDIVAKKGDRLYFVEVKTVTRLWGEDLKDKDAVNQIFSLRDLSDNYEPEDNLHPWKLKRLSRTIETYLAKKNTDDLDFQVDAICVYLEKGSNKMLKIEYLEDIF